MRLIQVADAIRYPRMTTEALRAAFLVDKLFQPGRVDLVYVDLDRTVIGSAVPLEAPLALEPVVPVAPVVLLVESLRPSQLF